MLLWFSVFVVLIIAATGVVWLLRSDCRGYNCARWGHRHSVVIRDANKTPVDATIVPFIGRREIVQARAWHDWLNVNEEEDRGWEWEDLVLETKAAGVHSGRRYELFSLVVGEIVEALMILQTVGRRSRSQQRPIVYVEYLSVAPHSRRSFSPRKYRYCGEVMTRFAMHRSETLGYGGGVGLHSLPGAEKFYEALGFQDFGPDKAESGYHYFETT